jgi:hypothetical protein
MSGAGDANTRVCLTPECGRPYRRQLRRRRESRHDLSPEILAISRRPAARLVAARLLVFCVAVAVAALFPLTAAAQAPTVELVPVNDVQVLSGSDSPCPFDITFTGTGTIELTTYYDNNGTPVRQSVHGPLTHTIFSAWHTLVSNGPAPVHIDLASGQMVDTGKELAFHVPGDGIVLGQSGRLISAADGSELSFVGHSVLDAAALCAALAPPKGQ